MHLKQSSAFNHSKTALQGKHNTISSMLHKEGNYSTSDIAEVSS